jgi:hypothetical protein
VIAQNYLHVETMTNSMIQQGSAGASQSQNIDTAGLRVLADTLRDAVGKLALEQAVANEACPI